MKTVWAAAVVTVLLTGYLGVMAWLAVLLFRNGGTVADALGVGILLLSLVGLWVVVATVREAFTHQRLAAVMRESGHELDLSGIERRPSGRLTPEAGELLVAQLRGAVDAHPEDWRAWYRLARGQDAAGDRSAARASMRSAVDLERGARPPAGGEAR